ncbi:hypothetical protein HAX54_031417 [Datura stramonium]|uniref:Uncharacterized protein n=1 Tax=Datura stramonium TaxID=4076 RepID=A0ABS8VC21_DATST|nr:hypothetical protein [Datura stramonium]
MNEDGFKENSLALKVSDSDELDIDDDQIAFLAKKLKKLLKKEKDYNKKGTDEKKGGLQGQKVGYKGNCSKCKKTQKCAQRRYHGIARYLDLLHIDLCEFMKDESEIDQHAQEQVASPVSTIEQSVDSLTGGTLYIEVAIEIDTPIATATKMDLDETGSSIELSRRLCFHEIDLIVSKIVPVAISCLASQIGFLFNDAKRGKNIGYANVYNPYD